MFVADIVVANFTVFGAEALRYLQHICRSSKVGVQGLVFVAHPLYIHTHIKIFNILRYLSICRTFIPSQHDMPSEKEPSGTN
jgi:hypothetical protein